MDLNRKRRLRSREGKEMEVFQIREKFEEWYANTRRENGLPQPVFYREPMSGDEDRYWHPVTQNFWMAFKAGWLAAENELKPNDAVNRSIEDMR